MSNGSDFFSLTYFFLFTVTLYLLHLSFVCTSCLIVLYVRINTEYIYILKRMNMPYRLCLFKLLLTRVFGINCCIWESTSHVYVCSPLRKSKETLFFRFKFELYRKISLDCVWNAFKDLLVKLSSAKYLSTIISKNWEIAHLKHPDVNLTISGWVTKLRKRRIYLFIKCTILAKLPFF